MWRDPQNFHCPHSSGIRTPPYPYPLIVLLGQREKKWMILNNRNKAFRAHRETMNFSNATNFSKARGGGAKNLTIHLRFADDMQEKHRAVHKILKRHHEFHGYRCARTNWICCFFWHISDAVSCVWDKKKHFSRFSLSCDSSGVQQSDLKFKKRICVDIVWALQGEGKFSAKKETKRR